MPQPAITDLPSPQTASSHTTPVMPPVMRRILRWTFWGTLTLYFAFVLLVCVLRIAVLPEINRYRDDIAQAIGRAIGQSVSIREIDAHWSGLRPLLNLHGIEIHDAAGRAVLSFEQVSAEPGWSSLLHGELRLAHLELSSPHLLLRRSAEGHLFVAGLDVTLQNTNSGFGKWLLAQHRIQITNATVTWQDELRRAPPLELRQLNLRLDNGWRGHHIGLSAVPPAALAAPLDIRGDLVGNDLQRLDDWSGQIFVQGNRIDLAGWHPWVDYPVALTQGSGALRLWLKFAKKRIASLTADVQLANVHLRLRNDLPELGLSNLGGRLTAERSADGFSFTTRQLTLTRNDGSSLPATDFALRWQSRAGSLPEGNLTANLLDLNALRQIAGYLPLPAAISAQLDRYAPQGRLNDLQAHWQGTAEHLAQWSIKGRLQQFGAHNLGPLAALAGIDGEIDGNEKAGQIHLSGQQSLIELPTVFAEPRVALDSFDAAANWKNGANGLQIELTQASFANPDAAGNASGAWQAAGGGPGHIDLTGRLTRANGAAVWRYMPLAVGQNTRDWLRNSIRGGVASDVKLLLKGDLKDFPFRSTGKQPSRGVFEVRGPFRDAALDYADGWPPITGIDGELLFAGERMLITGKSGKIFSVNLRDVRAEIADLEMPEELLTVTGQAQGASAEFLHFIDASPVSDYIDHFTETMRAEGNGALNLKLDLPLRKIANTTVAGEYRFDGNRLTVDANLPPLGDVRGTLRFSERQLEANNLRATLFGIPLSGSIKTAEDHGIDVSASGNLTIAALRQQISHPLLDNLSGNAKLNGTLSIRQKTATLKLTSNLLGLSSSLPEPLNKTASEALPLTIERRIIDDGAAQKVGAGRTAGRRTAAAYPREIFAIDLGQRLQIRLARRQDTNPPRIVWGRIRLGDLSAIAQDSAQEASGSGILVETNLAHLDADAWRRAFGGNNSGDDTDTAPLPAIQMDMRIGTLDLFDQSLHGLRLSGQSPAEAAHFNPHLTLKSREINGTLEWLSSGKGRLTAHLDKLAIPKPQEAEPVLQAKASAVVDQLPALDISIADFSFDGRSLGKLHLIAENETSQWNARIDINNEDDTLQSHARWRSHGQEETQLEFTLKSRNVDKFLQRIGYADVMRRGTATASGTLSWRGPPFHIDYPSLDGKFKLEASNGQFNKLEPGVGRLLGILSLQSLPRRITLDFHDIFSEGFAFNAIDGEFLVTKGVAKTENLHISGPAANILMNGAIDLAAETQNLQVQIQPAVSDSVSVGTMLVHPAVGAAVWAAQKLFKDPLGKALAYEYRITGPWADPLVVKSRQLLPASPQSSQTAPADGAAPDVASGADK